MTNMNEAQFGLTALQRKLAEQTTQSGFGANSLASTLQQKSEKKYLPQQPIVDLNAIPDREEFLHFQIQGSLKDFATKGQTIERYLSGVEPLKSSNLKNGSGLNFGQQKTTKSVGAKNSYSTVNKETELETFQNEYGRAVLKPIVTELSVVKHYNHTGLPISAKLLGVKSNFSTHTSTPTSADFILLPTGNGAVSDERLVFKSSWTPEQYSKLHMFPAWHGMTPETIENSYVSPPNSSASSENDVVYVKKDSIVGRHIQDRSDLELEQSKHWEIVQHPTEGEAIMVDGAANKRVRDILQDTLRGEAYLSPKKIGVSFSRADGQSWTSNKTDLGDTISDFAHDDFTTTTRLVGCEFRAKVSYVPVQQME